MPKFEKQGGFEKIHRGNNEFNEEKLDRRYDKKDRVLERTQARKGKSFGRYS